MASTLRCPAGCGIEFKSKKGNVYKHLFHSCKYYWGVFEELFQLIKEEGNHQRVLKSHVETLACHPPAHWNDRHKQMLLQANAILADFQNKSTNPKQWTRTMPLPIAISVSNSTVLPPTDVRRELRNNNAGMLPMDRQFNQLTFGNPPLPCPDLPAVQEPASMPLKSSAGVAAPMSLQEPYQESDSTGSLPPIPALSLGKKGRLFSTVQTFRIDEQGSREINSFNDLSSSRRTGEGPGALDEVSRYFDPSYTNVFSPGDSKASPEMHRVDGSLVFSPRDRKTHTEMPMADGFGDRRLKIQNDLKFDTNEEMFGSAHQNGSQNLLESLDVLPSHTRQTTPEPLSGRSSSKRMRSGVDRANFGDKKVKQETARRDRGVKITMVIRVEPIPSMENGEDLIDWVTNYKRKTKLALQAKFGSGAHNPKIKFPRLMDESANLWRAMESRRSSTSSRPSRSPQNRRNSTSMYTDKWTLSLKFDAESFFDATGTQDLPRCGHLMALCKAVALNCGIRFDQCQSELGCIVCKLSIRSSQLAVVLENRVKILDMFRELLKDGEIKCMPTVAVTQEARISFDMDTQMMFKDRLRRIIAVEVEVNQTGAIHILHKLLWAREENWKAPNFHVLNLQVSPNFFRTVTDGSALGCLEVALPPVRDLGRMFHKALGTANAGVVSSIMGIIIDYWALDAKPPSPRYHEMVKNSLSKLYLASSHRRTIGRRARERSTRSESRGTPTPTPTSSPRLILTKPPPSPLLSPLISPSLSSMPPAPASSPVIPEICMDFGRMARNQPGASERITGNALDFSVGENSEKKVGARGVNRAWGGAEVKKNQGLLESKGSQGGRSSFRRQKGRWGGMIRWFGKKGEETKSVRPPATCSGEAVSTTRRDSIGGRIWNTMKFIHKVFSRKNKKKEDNLASVDALFPPPSDPIRKRAPSSPYPSPSQPTIRSRSKLTTIGTSSEFRPITNSGIRSPERWEGWQGEIILAIMGFMYSLEADSVIQILQNQTGHKVKPRWADVLEQKWATVVELANKLGKLKAQVKNLKDAIRSERAKYVLSTFQPILSRTPSNSTTSRDPMDSKDMPNIVRRHSAERVRATVKPDRAVTRSGRCRSRSSPLSLKAFKPALSKSFRRGIRSEICKSIYAYLINKELKAAAQAFADTCDFDIKDSPNLAPYCGLLEKKWSEASKLTEQIAQSEITIASLHEEVKTLMTHRKSLSRRQSIHSLRTSAGSPPRGVETQDVRVYKISDILGRFNIPFFNDIPWQNDDEAECALEKFGRGEAIFAEGQDADCFYIIISGEVAVSVEGKAVARLGPGDYFGEIALILEVD
ncbi:hypothetical protein AAMO2058_001065800 [Amorphochlora amoebiformis]